ncbi:MAG TPA: dihydrodipicolinate synthase family protein [Christensenellaceae bacterium]|jgi:dihydrodipicolinate synthase/N-acetylneuraminate lyase|nr:dihydrodipicolinate synthase family protein [Christensenellaceae bacterium]
MDQNLRGVIPAVVTPLKADNSIDETGLKRHIVHIMQSGMKTLFMLGYAGEVFSFDRTQRQQIVSAARTTVGKEASIIAGIMDNSVEHILEHARDAKACGADYVLCTPTNFLPLSENEQEQLFIDIADSSPLPLIIYNCPENMHTLTPALLGRLCCHENIVGLKQTSDIIAIERMMQAVQNAPNFTLLSGDEFVFLGSLAVGVESFIMGGPGNLFPKTCLRIYNNFCNGKIQEARKEFLKMIFFLFDLYSLPILDLGGVKSVLELSGICERWMKRPTASADNQVLQSVKELMEQHQIQLD